VSVRLRRGADVLPQGGVRFSVWAPRCQRLDLKLWGPHTQLIAMSPARTDGGQEADAADSRGVFTVDVPDARPGMDYVFVVPGHGDRPDPTSRHQPRGPHGPSRIVDPDAHGWTDQAWRGRPMGEMILYELHVGTFTPAGTFDAAIERLPHLVDLGITAVELMPVAEFPGDRNWGYDGVNLYAPQSSYGGPAGLARLVDACHRLDLAVVLDVVYNHFGPDGNYLGDFGPYFTRRYATPWGEAVNFDDADSDPVRRFFIDNAVYWCRDLHIDALRLDAIHGIFDFGAQHILDQMKRALAAEASVLGRPLSLIAESDLNDPRILDPRAAGGYALDAQWSDDFHHAAFTMLTTPGGFAPYLDDFGGIADLRKAIAEGFVYDGRFSAYRRRRHGRSSVTVPGHQLVIYLENHDQIANGSRGHRLSRLVSPAAGRTAAALLFCAPNVPMLFMGQEFSATTPFHYFTSHLDPALAEAIRRGRRAEFTHLAAAEVADEWADPQAEETFARSRIDWACLDDPAHQAALRLHRDLIALRRRTPALRNGRKDLTAVQADQDQRWLTVSRADPDGGQALLLCNLGGKAVAMPVRPWGQEIPARPLQLALFTEANIYGGRPTLAPPPVLDLDPSAASPSAPVVSLPAWSAAVYV
jgi:maltooligosyltrehalose trehalohydrolase